MALSSPTKSKPLRYIKAVLTFNGHGNIYEAKADALFDTGAEVNLLPYRLIPAASRHLIQPNTTQISGVNGEQETTVGTIQVHIQLGDDRRRFQNIRMCVMNSCTDLLLGQPFWEHKSVKTYQVQPELNQLIINRKHRDGDYMAKFNLFNNNKRCVMNTSTGLNKQESTNNVGGGAHASNDGNKDHPDRNSKVSRDRSDSPTIRPGSNLEWVRNKWPKMKIGETNAQNKQPPFTENEIEETAKLCREYASIFNGDEDCLGQFYREVKIPTNGQSISQPPHTIPQAIEADVDAEINRMVADGIVEPNDDHKGFNTPIHAVKKKNGKIRLVLNFKRTINKILSEEDPYPLPEMSNLINTIGEGNNYFGVADLFKGYWQCSIRKQDRHITSFVWKGKTYRCCRLPMGLKTAGSIFCRAVGEALNSCPTLLPNIASYSDDNLLFSKDFETYIKAMRNFFNVLKEFGLSLNPDKCNFLTREAPFLGRVITSHGYKTDPEYVRDLLQWKHPTSNKELMSLIGRLVWIREFICCRSNESVKDHNFSTLMKTLNKLRNEKNVPFIWTNEAEASWTSLKRRLAQQPIIAFPDFTKVFNLVTDASDVAVAVVVQQVHDDGQIRICAVASQTLTKVEQRWSPTEKEAYAIRWAVEKFERFLRHRQFVIMTDHQALIYLDQTEFKNPKLARWQEYLEKFNFVCQYIPGESNVMADMFSRPNGVTKTQPTPNSDPAGKFYSIENHPQGLMVYIPSWNCPPGSDGQDFNLKFEPEGQQKSKLKTKMANYLTTGTAEIAEYERRTVKDMTLAEAQVQDSTLGKIIQLLKRPSRDHSDTSLQKSLSEIILKSGDERAKSLNRHVKSMFLLTNSDTLCIGQNPESTIKFTDTSGESFQRIIPTAKIVEYLNAAHEDLGHIGADRMKSILRGFWWPNKEDDVIDYTRSCDVCAARKGNHGRNIKINRGRLKRGSYPFQIVFIDFIKMKKPADGMTYCLTILDSFTRYLIVVPSRTETAADAAKGLIDNLWFPFRKLPKIVSSDRGTHFTSHVFAETLKLLNVKSELHTAWRPQSSGNIERQHRTLKDCLAMVSHDTGLPWTRILQAVVSNMNSLPNKATTTSPHFLIFGEHPEIFPGTPSTNTLTPASTLAYGLRKMEIQRNAYDHVTKMNAETDKYYQRDNKDDPVEYLEPGDIVRVKLEQSSEAKSTNMPWTGQFTVVQTTSQTALLIDQKGKRAWHHRHRIVKIPRRPPHLIEINPDEENNPNTSSATTPTPETSSSQTGSESGGAGSSQTIPHPTTHQEKDDIRPSPAKKLRRKRQNPPKSPDPPTRRSGRERKPTQKLNITSHRRKVYMASNRRRGPSQLCHFAHQMPESRLSHNLEIDDDSFSNRVNSGHTVSLFNDDPFYSAQFNSHNNQNTRHDPHWKCHHARRLPETSLSHSLEIDDDSLPKRANKGQNYLLKPVTTVPQFKSTFTATTTANDSQKERGDPLKCRTTHRMPKTSSHQNELGPCQVNYR